MSAGQFVFLMFHQIAFIRSSPPGPPWWPSCFRNAGARKFSCPSPTVRYADRCLFIYDTSNLDLCMIIMSSVSLFAGPKIIAVVCTCFCSFQLHPQVQCFDVDTRACLATLRGHRTPVLALDSSHLTSIALTASEDAVMLWNVEDWTRVRALGAGPGVEHVRTCCSARLTLPVLPHSHT